MVSDDTIKFRQQIMELREEDQRSQREYWTEEKRKKLEIDFNSGIGISEMAVEHNRSELAIVSQLVSMGLFHRTRNPCKPKSDCKCPSCKYYANCGKECPQKDDPAADRIR